MPSIVELIEQLNEVDEPTSIEAKRAADGIGKSSLETVSAFSNEPHLGGGVLLFGVSEVGGKFVITGVANPGKTASDFATQCAQAFNRAVRPHIWQESIKGKVVVAAAIPEVSVAEKPIFIKSKGMHHGAFRRIGGTDQRCTEDDLRILLGAGSAEPHEDSLVAGASMDDLDPQVIQAYRRGLLSANPATELRDVSDQALVQSMGGGRMTGGTLAPTVAGILLFGSTIALRRLFPAIRVDYIRVAGTEWVPDASRPYDCLEIRAPLLVAFRKAYTAVLEDLVRSFSLEPGSPARKEVPKIPESVVREVLANALVHRSYRVPSAIQVIRFNDRIEVRNPGHSLVEEDQLGQPGSLTRNPRIADVLREMHLAENKGTGIAAMRRAMKRAGLTPPMFESNRHVDRFVATLWLHNLLRPEETSWLEGLTSFELSDVQAQALVLARRAGQVRNSTLRDLTDLDPIEARRVLRGLRTAELLEMRGERGGAYYVLGPRSRAAADRGMLEAADRGMLEAIGTALNGDGGVMDADRGMLEADRGMADAVSVKLAADRGMLGAADRDTLGAIWTALDGNGGVMDADRGMLEADRGMAAADRGMLEAADRGMADADRGMLEAESAILDADSGILDANSKVLAADRGMAPADRGMADADKGMSRADCGELEQKAGSVPEQAAEQPEDQLPDDLQALLAALGPRPRKEKIRTAILRLCELRFWRPSELAKVLGLANPDKLVERHLAQMCSERLLVRRFPDKPRHPDQAYGAAQGSMQSRK